MIREGTYKTTHAYNNYLAEGSDVANDVFGYGYELISEDSKYE